MGDGYDGRGGIHYIRWRYNLSHVKLGQRVRVNMPSIARLHGKEGVLTGASVEGLMIVRPDTRVHKSERWRIHPLALDYL